MPLSITRTTVCILSLILLLVAAVAAAGCTSSTTSNRALAQPGNVRLLSPQSNATALFALAPDGGYNFHVAGTANVSDGQILLLWVKPMNPAAEPSGWFLQMPPRGVSTYNNETGVWNGAAQIGTAQYRPHQNDTFDVSVTVTNGNTATRLLNLPGVVIQPSPTGDVVDTATNVRVALA